MLVKINLKIFMISGVLSLNALGSQGPSKPELQEKSQSTRKRQRPLERTMASSSVSSSNPMNAFQPQEPDASIAQAATILVQLRTTAPSRQPTSPKLSTAKSSGYAASHSHTASAHSIIDTHKPTTLYKAIEDLKNNYNNLNCYTIRPFNEEITRLLHEGATINAQIFYLAKQVPYRGETNYVVKLLKEELASREQATYTANHHAAVNTSDATVTTASQAAAQAITCASSFAKSTADRAAASSALAPTMQTHLRDAYSLGYTANHPASSSSTVNLPPAAINNTNCGDQACPISKLTTKEMLLQCQISHVKKLLNTCPNRVLHKINDEPLGFILLDKAHSRIWGAMLVEALNSRGGPEFFEHQDIEGKTALHKLISDTSTAQIIKELYNKLDSYDAQDEHGHTPLYDAIEYLRNNKSALSSNDTGRVHEKIKVLLSRGAIINDQMLDLAKTIPYRGMQNYALEWLEEAQRSRRQADSNRDIVPVAANTSNAAVTTASQAAAHAITIASSLASSTADRAAVSSSPVVINNTNCGDQACPISKFITKKMLLEYRPHELKQVLQTKRCPDKTAHKINSEPLGFILLDKTDLGNSGILPLLFNTWGPKAFEFRDENGKTTLHKLVSYNKAPVIFNTLYKKLDSYDAQDEHGHTPLYDAIEYLKNNKSALGSDDTRSVHEKIKILLSRGAIINDHMLDLAKTIPYGSTRNYALEWLEEAQRSREQVIANRNMLPVSGTNYHDQAWPIFTNEEMVLAAPFSYFQNLIALNTCPDRALHTTNGKPIGFVLLKKTHSRHWDELLIDLLDTYGPKAFEYRDIDGKATLHRLVSNSSESLIFNKLYEKLDSYDAPDQQGHTPVYDAIEYLKNNKNIPAVRHITCIYEKIRTLLSRGAIINDQILELAKTIPCKGTKNYTTELLQEELQARRQIGHNQDISPAASSSSTVVLTTPQSPTTARSNIVAASSASAVQAYSQATYPSDYTASHFTVATDAASGNERQQSPPLSPNFYRAQSDYLDYDFSAQATGPFEDYSPHPEYSQSASPAGTRRNELTSPNPDDYFASNSFLYDSPADEQQEPSSYAAASSTADRVASSASSAQAQTQEDDGGVRGMEIDK